MKILLSLLLFFCSSPYLLRAQSGVVGTKLESVGLTEFLKNKPEDTNLDNKYKVLEFWATWCAPCLAAVPHLNELQKEFRENKDLVFVSVTYEKPEVAERIFKKVDFQTIVATDQSRQLFRNLQVEKNGSVTVPATVLVDAQNVVKWVGKPKDLTPELLRSFIEGKNLSTVEKKEIVEKTAEVPKQSLQNVLLQNRDNETLKSAFVISDALESDKRSMMMNGVVGLFVFNKTPIKSIFSGLLKVPAYRVVFGDTAYNNAAYNVFYKNSLRTKENFSVEAYNNEMVLVRQRIIDALGLKESVVAQATDVFEIQVKDGSRLQVTEEKEQSRSSSDEGVLSMVNYNLKDVAAVLSNAFGAVISYNGEESKKYDFTIIHKDNIESLEKALETYGIELKKGSEMVDYYTYEKR